MSEAEGAGQTSPGIEQEAAQRANGRANNDRWNLDIAVFLFAVLIIVIILLFQQIRIDIVAPIAVFGLAMVWLCGWKRGRQLYQRYLDEELIRLRRESKKLAKEALGEAIEETIEEKVQKAFRDRLK